jgi:hypothetical protein
MAWSEASASCSSRDGVANGESFLPMRAQEVADHGDVGLKTFEDGAPPP